MYIEYGYSQKTTSSLVLATVLHGLIYAALLYGPLSSPSEMFPEGTTPITVDFEAFEAPKGEQIFATQKAKFDRESQMGALATPKTTQSSLNEEVVIVAPTPAKSKKQPKAKKPKKMAVASPLPIKSPPKKTLDESPVAIKSSADILKESSQDFDDQDFNEYEDLESQALAQVEPQEENLDESALEEELEEDNKITPVPVVVQQSNTETSPPNATAQNQKKNNELPEKTVASTALLNGPEKSHSQNTTPHTSVVTPDDSVLKSKGLAPNGPHEKTSELPATAIKAFGLPKGTVSYLNLKQRPGNVAPHYPFSARRQGWTGKTVLLYYVDDLGLVKNVQIKQSSGYKILDEAAVQGIKRWRFYKGQPSWTLHPVNFKLQGPTEQSPSRLRLRANS